MGETPACSRSEILRRPFVEAGKIEEHEKSSFFTHKSLKEQSFAWVAQWIEQKFPKAGRTR